MTHEVFRSHCTASVARILNDTTPIRWRAEQNIHRRTRIDVFGDDGQRVYLVEIEMRREDPVNNVIKIWRWIEESPTKGQPKRAVLFQVFSAFYERRRAKMENAQFAGRKMAEDLECIQYRAISWDLNPPVGGETFPQDTDDQIRVLCHEIASSIDRIYGHSRA